MRPNRRKRKKLFKNTLNPKKSMELSQILFKKSRRNKKKKKNLR